MDAIFGASNYRNHITWKRATAHNDAKRFGRIADHILFYGKTRDAYWNGDAARVPKTEEELRASFPQNSGLGPVRFSDLTGPSHGMPYGSPSTLPWRGYDVYSMGRVWSAPKTGHYARYIEENFIPGYRSIQGVHDRLDALDAAGLIHHPTRGKWPGLKRYAASDRGHLEGIRRRTLSSRQPDSPTSTRAGGNTSAILPRSLSVCSNPSS